MPCSHMGELPRESPATPSLFLTREELQSLFQARAKLPPVCRAVAGLEGTSQQALHRSRVVRRAFASSLAAVKRKAPCAQIKLQMVSELGSLWPWTYMTGTNTPSGCFVLPCPQIPQEGFPSFC